MAENSESPEQKLFLARYNADRAHELELDKIAARYELAFFQSAGILNGVSVTLFLSTFDKLHLKSSVWILSVVAWLLGLVLAIPCSNMGLPGSVYVCACNSK
jgi:hypothetical protein